MCVGVCVCFPLMISWFVTCDYDLTGWSEGSNERVAIQVITKGMKHRLVWCFLLVVAFFFFFLHGNTCSLVVVLMVEVFLF